MLRPVGLRLSAKSRCGLTLPLSRNAACGKWVAEVAETD
jgi:hypothetical protein